VHLWLQRCSHECFAAASRGLTHRQRLHNSSCIGRGCITTAAVAEGKILDVLPVHWHASNPGASLEALKVFQLLSSFRCNASVVSLYKHPHAPLTMAVQVICMWCTATALPGPAIPQVVASTSEATFIANRLMAQDAELAQHAAGVSGLSLHVRSGSRCGGGGGRCC